MGRKESLKEILGNISSVAEQLRDAHKKFDHYAERYLMDGSDWLMDKMDNYLDRLNELSSKYEVLGKRVFG